MRRLILILAVWCAAAQPVVTNVFPPEQYAARRARVIEKIGDGAAILQGTTERPGEQPLRQSNQFFYLCGVVEPRAILIIDGKTRRTTLFLNPRNERREQSMFGPGLYPGDAAAKETGVEAVLPRDQFQSALDAIANQGRAIYTPFRPEVLGSASSSDTVALARATRNDPWYGRVSREEAFIAHLKEAAPRSEIRNLDPILDELRGTKSPREIAIIREATRITGLGIMEAMRDAKPGMREYELQADCEFVFKKYGSYGPAYFALIATGPNTYYTHYHRDTAMLRDGDLVQLDYAPDYRNYTSDVTRVFPANGKFTPWQQEFYGIYLQLYRALMSSIRVHAAPSEIIREAVVKMDAVMAAYPFTDPKIKAAAVRFVENYRNSRANSLGHTVGMEVHDVRNPTATLEPGQLFTIEPQMRIEEEHLGLRLEDMILITESGYENLSAFVPIEIPDIEKLMASGHGLSDTHAKLERPSATVHAAAAFDLSPPLNAMDQSIPDQPVIIHPAVESRPERVGAIKGPGRGLGATPPAIQPGRAGARSGRSAARPATPPITAPPMPDVPSASAAVEQTLQGERPAIEPGASFDGLGDGFTGREFPGSDGEDVRGAGSRGGIDISLAVGPDHIIEILNGSMAVFTKKGRKYKTTGKLLYGAVPNNTVFAGFGVRCGVTNNSDTVVRYDQLADRWLIVLPVFSRPPDNPQGPYAMCYAVSATSDPLGPYYRYEFQRPLFPDYPRPAVWPDGYYNPTSTSDNPLPGIVTQKHDCIADRRKMLKGLPATEQCVVIDGGVFLLNADLDGKRLPPAGAPNIMMSTGGTQLLKIFDDDGVYFYKVHVDWSDPAKTSVSAPRKIPVAPYHYLCDGQLSNCVSQPGTTRRLDSQGDKLIQRLVYRNFGDHESVLAEHSVDTAAHGGGVRWYEFRLDAQRSPALYQQGTYAPDRFFRWLGSMAMDRKGNIGIGYSFGGDPNFPGQRFAARLAGDPKGQLTFHESVLAAGQASQTGSLRWEDYTNITVDPSDDCTLWFVGNYLKAGAESSTTRIGSFLLPGCK